MDFFEQQDRARRATRLLIVLFALAVLLITAAINAVADFVYVEHFAGRHDYLGTAAYSGAGDDSGVAWWNPQLFLIVTAVVLATIFTGCVYRINELRQGGGVVASMLGGTPINITTNDPDERRLLNVIEEMAIASGIAVPQVFVLYNDNAINAFAAGNSRSDSTIGVTYGAMKLLSRDELQGVVAHEFSHILNGDMVLNMRLMGIVYGIVCISQFGSALMQTRSSYRSDDSSDSPSERFDGSVLPRSSIAVAGLAIFLIGMIGLFFGRLIRGAISRQREYLADASAVQFTRNPEGIAGALKKIGGSPSQSYLRSPQAEDAGHFLFGNPSASSWFQFNLFATHPPLQERIRAIDPHFNGKFVIPQSLPPGHDAAHPANSNGAALAMGVAAAIQPAPARQSMQNAGAPDIAHLKYAAGFRAALPQAISDATRDITGACALMNALLISADPSLRRRQLILLQPQADTVLYETTIALLPEIAKLKPGARLPLIDLAVPALRQLTRERHTAFRAGIELLINSDSRVDLFEYSLRKVLMRNLDPTFNPAPRRATQYQSLQPLLPDCVIVLSTLAYVAHGKSQMARGAFDQGARQLNVAGSGTMQLAESSQCNYSALDAALDRLNLAVPYVKKNVLFACGSTVMADNTVQVEEWELLRAIADSLDCPIPPFVETSARGLIMQC